jgi:hypothetical protein
MTNGRAFYRIYVRPNTVKESQRDIAIHYRVARLLQAAKPQSLNGENRSGLCLWRNSAQRNYWLGT